MKTGEIEANRGVETHRSLQLVRQAALAKLLGVSRTSLYTWRRAGKFPAPLRLGSGLYWKTADVDRFLEARKAVADVAR